MNRRHSILIGAALLAGCRHYTGIQLTRKDLNANRTVRSDQILTLDKEKMPVVVMSTPSPGALGVSIRVDNVEIEQEHYQISDSGVSLASESDDAFTPPLPIVDFPATGGQSWQWSGSVTEGPTTRSATAKIDTSNVTLYFKDGERPAILVEAKLSVDSGTPVPAQRFFRFWFTKDGLVKREFGLGTTRSVSDLEQ